MSATGRPLVLTTNPAAANALLDFVASENPLSARHRRGAGVLALLLLASPFAIAAGSDARPKAAAAATPASTHRKTALSVAPRSFDRPPGQVVPLSATQVNRDREGRASRSGERWPIANMPEWVRPGNGLFTSGFKRRWGRMHKGIDLAAPTGSPVVAAAKGVVTYADRYSTFGKFVTVRHPDGLVTAYAHLSDIDVEVGDRVDAGEHIGNVGSTGHSTGPHLHFEVRRNGVQIDPQKFLREHGVWL
jgi:murein DD-endopeptidase MepM/ murein hydrolase activator NlpD